MEGETQIKAPGLKWIKRTRGRTPFWVANEVDVSNGYSPKTVNLYYLADQPDMLKAKCDSLQAEMLLWRTGYRADPLKFDGSIKSLLSIYETHPRSTYRKLRPGSLRPYNHYLKNLKAHIGSVRIDDTTGVDLMDWHDVWSENGRYLAAATTARAVLFAAVSFGIMMRLQGCGALAAVMRETAKTLPHPKPRNQSATAQQIVAARAAAHKNGRPSSALAYALCFETVLRLWDAIGQWWPVNMGGISEVFDADRDMKWFGLRWEDINADMVLHYTPSKTADSSGAIISYSLQKAPMVMDELKHWPVENRTGPMIVSEENGLPWRASIFAQRWTVDRKAAGLPTTLWARDLRASGITEGRASGARLDDASKVAGHTATKTTEKYDRAVLEAADRFAEARLKRREQSGNSSGNAR
ncbi:MULTISPECIES: integrase [unclassified Mesorhizobium]|uniref:integrase n=1 Tax=unclassified Mesorhizobium TaxID=325217 RepID=UPI001093FB85|nr:MULTISPECIES: integrase [unclassified Mesorhizobium]TGT91251.1 integrase [Mesorhizobium sp. M8A.F.Ca.ET.161.01.1.1]TGV43469.1 integrase [Mesorhizobium sp. M8A.F.Ca.ET.142.01.1.1]